MHRRPDNVAGPVAAGPVQFPPPSAESSMTSSDAEWLEGKYRNFRAFVRSLSSRVETLEAWADRLDRLPLAVFLAGGAEELKAVREAKDPATRRKEAILALERGALQYGFELGRLRTDEISRLCRYTALFALA